MWFYFFFRKDDKNKPKWAAENYKTETWEHNNTKKKVKKRGEIWLENTHFLLLVQMCNAVLPQVESFCSLLQRTIAPLHSPLSDLVLLINMMYHLQWFLRQECFFFTSLCHIYIQFHMFACGAEREVNAFLRLLFQSFGHNCLSRGCRQIPLKGFKRGDMPPRCVQSVQRLWPLIYAANPTLC